MKSTNIVLDYTPRPWQAEFHRKADGKRHAVSITARQQGKTHMAIAELVDRALTGPEKTNYAYVAPTLKQARRVSWDRIKEYLAPLAAHLKISETDNYIDLPGQRRIYMLGVDNESARGLSLRGIVADEFDSMDSERWRSVFIPTLTNHPDHWVIYIGTLAQHGKLWDLLVERRDDPDWHCQITKATDTDILSSEQLEAFRREMGDGPFAREYLCDPAAPVQHSVVGDLIAEAQAEGRITALPHQAIADVGCAWDLGIRDATAIWLYQAAGHRIHIIGYREYAGIGLIKIIQRLRKEYPSYNWGDQVLPHDIAVRDYASGNSRLDTFHDMVFGEPCPLGRTNVADGLHNIRTNLSRCIFDAEACEVGLQRLKTARYEVDQRTSTVQDRVVHDHSSHALDSFRYLCTHLEHRNPTARSESFTNRSGYSNWDVPINDGGPITTSRRRRGGWGQPIN